MFAYSLLLFLLVSASAECLRGILSQDPAPYHDLDTLCNEFLGKRPDTISRLFNKHQEILREVVTNECFQNILFIENNRERMASYFQLELLDACNCLEDITAELTVGINSTVENEESSTSTMFSLIQKLQNGTLNFPDDEASLAQTESRYAEQETSELVGRRAANAYFELEAEYYEYMGIDYYGDDYYEMLKASNDLDALLTM